MTRRGRAAAAALCCAVLAQPTAALAAPGGPSAAASPGGAGTGALPPIAQTTGAARQEGCVKPSGSTTDRTPWAQIFLRPEAAWPLSRGAGVTVAVVGSGVDGSSGALDGRLVPGPRLQGTGGSDRDCVGHGTFLAGLIAARQRDGTGFAGIAPAARILAVAVTDDTGTTTAALLAAGIRAAVDGGAAVVAVAVPVAAGSTELAAAVRYAADRGVLVVAPAAADGDTGTAAAAEVFPAAYPEVLAVSGIGPGGSASNDSASNGGASNGTARQGGSGAARIDLVAPGTAMTSIGPGGPGHFTGSGPSFATAVVAGTAALVLGRRPDLTRARLLDRLKATAYRPGTTLPDPVLGWGTVDPVAAVGVELPEETVHGGPGGAAGRTAPGVAPLPPTVPDPAGRQAVLLAGGVLAATALVGGAVLVLARGRRRGWRPGRWTA
ncbi:S8 family serine peptidase [Kitasatospora sp. KL5]|uniref:S8 family serine peptidase n=1 Tax=Kitasatospora sp. KL5 TaxID=3425125 RepID=UPI003D6F634F